MQFITAQVACLCFGIVAVNVLHKFGVPGFVHEESFGNILVGTLALQGASWLMIPFFFAPASSGLAQRFWFPRAGSQPSGATGLRLYHYFFDRVGVAMGIGHRAGEAGLAG